MFGFDGHIFGMCLNIYVVVEWLGVVRVVWDQFLFTL